MKKIGKLTKKEEEIMEFFWKNKALFVREILRQYTIPPHYNTLSTIVRGLEKKGFLSYKAYGKTHQYFAIISKEDYKNEIIKNLVAKYFKNSYCSFVTMLIEQQELSIEELKDLIIEEEKRSEV